MRLFQLQPQERGWVPYRLQVVGLHGAAKEREGGFVGELLVRGRLADQRDAVGRECRCQHKRVARIARPNRRDSAGRLQVGRDALPLGLRRSGQITLNQGPQGRDRYVLDLHGPPREETAVRVGIVGRESHRGHVVRLGVDSDCRGAALGGRVGADEERADGNGLAAHAPHGGEHGAQGEQPRGAHPSLRALRRSPVVGPA